MKRSYTYVKPEDVTACKELIGTMIKRDKRRCSYRLNENDAHEYAYQAAKFFDVMQQDFRFDLEEWALEEIRKAESV
ncbi:hypothetical protein [Ruminococcus sp.]|uniref:hypothetical protein n=1 Tax=Ruminococcus sp. TaxID=41978 RepID=UPI0025EC691B|nr:hypothetical protein [Ruminococcus sp.]MBQ8966761.1 hypothetical protein [Ruminococcus sp.]